MLENNTRPMRKEINLIPLINIIFLLLTFFMIAGTIEKTDPFSLTLPQVNKADSGVGRSSIVVYLNKEGKIAVNNDMVLDVDFPTIINTLLIDDKERPIIIKSDAKLTAKTLIWALQVIENLGGRNVAIVTKVAK